MAFVEATCKNCGGTIRFDDAQETGVCEFCGTKFITQEMYITNNIHNDFANATVIYKDESSIEQKLNNAEVFLVKLKQYDEAKEIYKYVIKNKSGDYRGWWGMVRVLSKEFTDTSVTKEEFDEISGYAESAFKVADKAQKKQIMPDWENYRAETEKQLSQTLAQQEEDQRIQSERIKKQKTARAVRKTLGIGLSLASNGGLLAWFFLNNIAQNADETWETLIGFLITLLVNSILTTIFGFIGSTKSCSWMPAAVTAVIIALTLKEALNVGDVDIIAWIIGSALFIVAGLVVILICAVIPLAALHGIGSDTDDEYEQD